MGKPIKDAVSYVIYKDPEAKGDFLVVQRPADDKDLPNVWGLPAGSRKDGESWEDSVRRSGKEKLGVELEVVAELNEGTLERKDYVLRMKLFETVIASGEPSCPQPIEGVTQYSRWKWSGASILKESASKGSLCCSLQLLYLGVPFKQVPSLKAKIVK